MAKIKWNTHQERIWAKRSLEILKGLIDINAHNLILGVDPSSSGMGIFGVNHSTKNVVAVNSIGKSSNSQFENCSDIFKAASASCLNLLKSSPHTENNLFVFFEETSVSTHFTGLKAVATAKGSVFAAISNATSLFSKDAENVFVIPVYISQIKRALTGNNKASKGDIMNALKKAGLEFYDDNQADAYGAYLIGSQLLDIAASFDVSGYDETDQKSMREFQKEIDAIDADLFPTFSLLKDPKMTKRLLNGYQYDKIVQEIKEL